MNNNNNINKIPNKLVVFLFVKIVENKEIKKKVIKKVNIKDFKFQNKYDGCTS